MNKITKPSQVKGAFHILNTDFNSLLEYVEDTRKEIFNMKRDMELLTKKLEKLVIEVEEYKNKPLESIIELPKGKVNKNNKLS